MTLHPWIRHWWFMFVLVCPMCFGTQGYPQLPDSPAPKDAISLQLFYLVMLHAYQQNHIGKFPQLLTYLELPKKATWLDDHFRRDQTSELLTKYATNFQAFGARLAKSFGEASNGNSEIKINEIKNSDLSVYAQPGPIMPKPDLVVKSYKFTLTIPGTGRIEWIDSFCQVEGSLRFVGGGIFPFWSGTPSIRVRKTGN